MRVLVTGAHGQLGRDLVDAFAGRIPEGGSEELGCDLHGGRSAHEVVGLSHAALDVTDAKALAAALDAHQPELVVNAASWTAVDAAEADPEACREVVVGGTARLLEGCANAGAKLLTFSTDYVFDGEKATDYVEEDRVHPINAYGAAKAEAEALVGNDGLTVRTSWLAGVHGSPTVLRALQRVAGGQPVAFVDDQVGAFTASADLAAGVVALAATEAEGIIHLANTGAVSWFELVAEAVRLAGLDGSLVSATSTDQLDPQPAAARPARSVLACPRAALLGITLPGWQNGLARLVAART